jgi:CopG family transcriptional regulator, nickel-responsive regulator
MEKLLRFGVSMEETLLESFDEHISSKGYSNRSEAIRDMVREKLGDEELQNNKQNAIGTLTFVYDHHKREIEENLNKFQHDHFENVISTTHIHLDHDNCLEVILLKGPSGLIKHIADKILSFKGVKQGKFNLTSYGNFQVAPKTKPHTHPH